ncbi:mannonate dehydratase [Flagellimonas pelagia]|uniref:Mannonate dehydratase n=2 Tax=Flagellimonas pelagia TaxID=2306998 RepID=A0A3A1NK42_9FLAO|nr:mannonate dehydratase [Allomuricauda maritima]TXJ99079.1 mannonate dehydratase [Allomuricauda maritima]
MIKMQQTMRWYGPHDTIKLRDIRQCGVEGIVTALHQIPVGEVWEVKDIMERQQTIRDQGLEWTVIESLPVHEDIKRKRGNYKQYILNYGKSLENLAQCGLKVVTYNFMPVLDWVRTEHEHINSDGTKALLFDETAFTYFDVFLLKRSGAEADYTKEKLEEASAYGNALDENEKQRLFKNVLLGLPGSTENFTREKVLELLEDYKGVNDGELRKNLIYFLTEIVPVAEKLGVKLAIHPDDPPFSVLGLPRVVSTESDLEQLFNAVPSRANGLCYCTGSLGARPSNDLLQIIDQHGDRIHFLHLRNVKRDNDKQFRESEHLNGDNPMEAIMEQLLLLMQRRGVSIPMRPDHGFLHSFEGTKEQYPGYSLMGRLKGLAEIRGLERGISYKINRNG